MFKITVPKVSSQEVELEVQTPSYRRETSSTLIRIDDETHVTMFSHYSFSSSEAFHLKKKEVDLDEMKKILQLEDASSKEWFDTREKLTEFIFNNELHDEIKHFYLVEQKCGTE